MLIKTKQYFFKIIKTIKNIIISTYSCNDFLLTYKNFTKKKTKNIKSKLTFKFAHTIKNLKINDIIKLLATIDIGGHFHNITKHPTIILHILIYLFLITVLYLLLAYFFFDFLYRIAKFVKGDPISCPHYKKTYYFRNRQYSNYDFYPYFNDIEQKLKENENIQNYLWVFSFDTNSGQFYKAEFFCVYKIGIKKSLLTFDMADFIYWDKKKRLHSIAWLIECRINELSLMTDFYLENHPTIFENENITERVYYKNELLAYNLNLGHIRYQTLIKDYKPLWHS